MTKLFDEKILDEAVKDLSPEGKEQIALMVKLFEGFKAELEKLKDISEAFETTCIKLTKEKEELQIKNGTQAEKLVDCEKIITTMNRVIDNFKAMAAEKSEEAGANSLLIKTLNEPHQ